MTAGQGDVRPLTDFGYFFEIFYFGIITHPYAVGRNNRLQYPLLSFPPWLKSFNTIVHQDIDADTVKILNSLITAGIPHVDLL